jgi:hypothetical protein
MRTARCSPQERTQFVLETFFEKGMMARPFPYGVKTLGDRENLSIFKDPK